MDVVVAHLQLFLSWENSLNVHIAEILNDLVKENVGGIL